MPELESLEILIEVIDSFSEELDQLLFKLGEVSTAIEAVDAQTLEIDVDDRELSAAHRKLTALQGQQMARIGSAGTADGAFEIDSIKASNIDINAGQVTVRASTSVGGGGGGGGVSGAAAEAADAMEDAADGADEAAEGLFGMDLRMTDVHNALARLVPAILVIIGAIPALLGGLVTLATAAAAAAVALGGLVGLGLLGAAQQRGGGDAMEGLSDMFEQVQDDFLDAFSTLADQLAPMFERGLEGLGVLFRDIAREAGDALLDLRDELEAVGGFLLETIPAWIEAAATFAEAFAPTFGVMAALASRLNILETFASFTADALPHLISFTDALITLLPVIMDLSIGFLRVTAVMMQFVAIVGQILTSIPIVGDHMGLLIGGLLAAWTATMLLNKQMFIFATSALMKAGVAVFGLIQALTGYNVVGAIAQATTVSLAKAVVGLAGAMALLGGLGILMALFGGIASGASLASNKIDEATKSLEAFQAQQNSMTGGQNPYREPELGFGRRGGGRGARRGGITINVEGDADKDTLREQGNNAMYRMKRRVRK